MMSFYIRYIETVKPVYKKNENELLKGKEK